jgi:hypothetical protein
LSPGQRTQGNGGSTVAAAGSAKTKPTPGLESRVPVSLKTKLEKHMLLTEKRHIRCRTTRGRVLNTTRYARMWRDFPRQDANATRINKHRSPPKSSLAVRIEYMTGRWIFRLVRDEVHAQRVVRRTGIARTMRLAQTVKLIRSTAHL